MAVSDSDRRLFQSANVKVLQTKIGELGIKVITEPVFDSPEGKKRAFVPVPSASREAVDKALEKIKRRIGVGGVVAACQCRRLLIM